MQIKLTFWKNLAFDANFKREHAKMFFTHEHEVKFTTLVGSKIRWPNIFFIDSRHGLSYRITAGP